jgi:IS30 family transposase
MYYEIIEQAMGLKFATPHHAWEWGTNEKH